MSKLKAARSTAIALLAGAALALSGCVSAEGSDAQSALDTGPVSVGPEVSGTPIVIGTICSCTGPVSSSTGQVEATWEAWAKWTNSNGGINGHPVEVIIKDDGLDAARSVQMAKELIEQDRVMAIVGEQDNLNSLWADYARDQGVPVIGAAVFTTAYETNPMFFPTGAQTPTQAYGVLAEIEKTGGRKVTLMVCAESPTCADNAATFEQLTELFPNIEVVSSQRVTGDAPNYTAPCLAARSAEADVLVPLVAPAVVPRIVASCVQQGYSPSLFTNSYVPGNDWAEDPNLEGFITVSPNQSLWTADSPATRAFHDALNTFAPGIRTKPEFNAADSSVWAAAEVFKLAAERAGLNPDSTSQDVLGGLFTFESETVDGLTPPLTFIDESETPPLVACWYISAIENGVWTAPNGAEASCIPEDQREAVEALFVQPTA